MTDRIHPTRRLAMAAAASSVAWLAQGASAAARKPRGPSPFSFRLVPRPTRVFKTPDGSHEATESWVFSLMIETPAPAGVEPVSLQVDLLKGAALLRRATYTAEGIRAMTYHPRLPPGPLDGLSAEHSFFWPAALRLRDTVPIAQGVDAVDVALEAADASGRRGSARIRVPIETYAQKTGLIFPFKGNGIILQGGATNGGHRNRSGEFAIDACGLDAAWSVEAPGDGKRNEDYPGWGRTLIAPADGVVVRARKDRPDQPVGDANDRAYYAPEYKDGGDVGNYVVIDHGSGEFSMMAHFQAGSVLVEAGQGVRQGQPLGKLGHSGDTDMPHLHYQLQSGPDWEYSDGLPARFSNVSEAILNRGTYFSAA